MPKPAGTAPVWRQRRSPGGWERACFYARLGEYRLEVSVQMDSCVVRVYGREPQTDAQLTLHTETVQQGSGGIPPTDLIISRARLRCVSAALRLQKESRS